VRGSGFEVRSSKFEVRRTAGIPSSNFELRTPNPEPH
jgi:hypothetical protein